MSADIGGTFRIVAGYYFLQFERELSDLFSGVLFYGRCFLKNQIETKRQVGGCAQSNLCTSHRCTKRTAR